MERRPSARRGSRRSRMPSSPRARGVFVDARPFVGEHSLEMHLIMLQAMLPAPFEIVPILVGDADPHWVAEALRLVWGGPETGIAVSSDLSHFLDRESAKSIDADTARLIETLDAQSLEGRRACGFLPIKGALEIAAERDLRVSRLHLATSADAGAGASRVVGYGAFGLEYAASAQLAEADREHLLSACMAALGAAAENGGKPPAPSLDGGPPALAPWRATFVTLTERRTAARLHRFARAAAAARRGCGRQYGQGGLCRPALSAARRGRTRRASPRRLGPLAPAADSGGKRVRTRRRARARPRRPGPWGRRTQRALPAERLAPGRRRSRIRPQPDGEGRLRNESLAGGAHGCALPRRIVRRPLAIGRCEGNRAGDDRSGADPALTRFAALSARFAGEAPLS